MAGKQVFTAEQVAAALDECDGMLFLAAKKLGCHVNTVRRYKQRYATVASVVAQKHGEMVDTAESALLRGLKKGEPWAVCFTLKTQGKDRGYVERQELTGADGKQLVDWNSVFARKEAADPVESRIAALEADSDAPDPESNGHLNGEAHE